MTLISIVIPVYYNAGSLHLLMQRLDAFTRQNSNYEFEFIFVDDGSGDNSLSVIQELSQNDERVNVVKLSRNFGSDSAILAGMSVARGDCVGFVAADLQDPPEVLTEMLDLWQQGNKVIFAVRKDRKGDPVTSRIFSYIFNTLFTWLIYKGIPTHGIGFFLVDKQVSEVLLKCDEKNPHLFGLILWTGFSYTTVPYDREERLHGSSRWTFPRKLKFFIDAFVASTYLPIRLSSSMGVILASIGAVYAVVVLIAKITRQIPVAGFAALMIALLILSGVQLIMLGVIGEYLWRTLDASRKRPTFIIESYSSGRNALNELPDIASLKKPVNSKTG